MPSPTDDENLSAEHLWIKRVLDYVRGGAHPRGPVSLEWECSLGGLLCEVFGARRLPAPVIRRLARLGELYLSPRELGINGARVRWNRIEEIRTRNARDVLVETSTGKAIGLAGNLLPHFLPSRRVTAKIQQIVSSLLRAALDKVAAEPKAELPSEIVHRSRFGQRKYLSIGLFASSLMALRPDITRSLLTTAQRNHVPVRCQRSRNSPA